MLAHVPSFGRTLEVTGLPGVSRSQGIHACSRYWGSEVLGCCTLRLDPKAALALGCSLTPGLGISFGRVTCMARAA